MLEFLRVKNVALIDSVEINFGVGLNILSGETGAGKSIIIDSINFVLGQKAAKDFIRTGEDFAEVEAFISVDEDSVIEAIYALDLGISIAEDRSLVLFRSLSSAGKTVCRINGKAVTVGMLKEISALLVDIHGQHEHQSLLDSKKHIALLDRFCGTKLANFKVTLSEIYRQYRENARQIKTIGDAKDRGFKVELYSFQIKDIEAAALTKDEDDELLKRRKVLNSSEKLNSYAQTVAGLLYEGEKGNRAALEKISKAKELLGMLTELDPDTSPINENLNNIYYQLEEAVTDFKKYCRGLEFDPSELEGIERRLDTIHKLKKKYGTSVNEILGFLAETKHKLELIENSQDELIKLNNEKKAIEKEIVQISAKMTEIRKEAGVEIETSILENLKQLGMINASFSIDIQRKKEFSMNGCDAVEFLISPNKGEPLKQLALIASGGEMSRVMLALKAVLSKFDSIETFIFDEIDTGVSGRTAQQVAEKLALIARQRQILCITHLPQIAAMGDENFLIEKKSDELRTVTEIYRLDRSQVVKEIARLIGGAEITNMTLIAAEEMKDLANNLKTILI